LLKLVYLSYFEHTIQSLLNTCLLVSILKVTPNHVPLKYKGVLIRKKPNEGCLLTLFSVTRPPIPTAQQGRLPSSISTRPKVLWWAPKHVWFLSSWAPHFFTAVVFATFASCMLVHSLVSHHSPKLKGIRVISKVKEREPWVWSQTLHLWELTQSYPIFLMRKLSYIKSGVEVL
jgi:hypothetical protein